MHKTFVAIKPLELQASALTSGAGFGSAVPLLGPGPCHALSHCDMHGGPKVAFSWFIARSTRDSLVTID